MTKIDCSTPYKTFNDLKDEDEVFILDCKRLTIEVYKITDYKRETNDDCNNCGRYRIDLTIVGLGNLTLLNGNILMSSMKVTDTVLFVTTDPRLCRSVLDVLSVRNEYQWESFCNIFGRPEA